MIVKICPLCDSEMKKAHYCDVCHSFVWKPTILDVHYNTESRGRGEVDCAYGELHDKYDHHQSHIERQHRENEAYWREHERQQKEFEERRHGQKRQAAAKKGTAAADHAEVFGTQVKKKKNSSGGCGGCLVWIIVAFFVIRIIAGVGGLSNVFSRNLRYWIWKLEHQVLNISREMDGENMHLAVGELSAGDNPVLSYLTYGKYTEYDLGDAADWEYALMDLETGGAV